MPNRRCALIPLVVFVLLAIGGAARAQERSFSPQLFHPAPGPAEFVDVESPVPLGHMSWGAGLFLNYARNELELAGFDTGTMKPTGAHAALIAHALAADLWAGLGLWNRFQIALALPMTLVQVGDDFNDLGPDGRGAHVAAPSGFALGDPRIHLKVRLYGHESGFQISLSHWLSIPLGDDSAFGGEQHFGGFAGEPRLLLGWEAARFRVAAFAGFLWRAHTSSFFSTAVGQQLTYGGAGAFDAVPGRFTLIAELYGHSNSFDSVSTALGVVRDVDDAPLELDLAGRIGLVANLSLTVGVGYGILPGIGAPQPRVYTGVVYARDTHDRDHDGVPDNVDQCPNDPEDKDGFQDQDGCPDPDNDRDSIPDAHDKCPNQAEDFDQFEDEDGCPDPDNDKDGIDDLHDACPNDPEDHKPPKPNDGCPLSKTDTDKDGITDDKDKCPTEAEDRDGFEDEDGCPDVDNDKDGIPDSFDQCPNQPEDIDGFKDEDGCPDPDNDQDGVPDKTDKCPNEPETINGYQDEDGCPDKGPPPKVKVENGQIVILEKVFFDTNKANIKPKSFNLLDQVALTIKAHDFKIRIEGYTDSRGSTDHNVQLSQERADAVRTYLIKKAIDPSRLISAGYGPADPIASNKTSAGREANRRVEFHIVEDKKPAPAGQAPAPAEDSPNPEKPSDPPSKE